MDTPECATCGTDKYLRITSFEEAYDDDLAFPMGNGDVVHHSQHHAPVVQFLCRKCGYRNGYSVPDDWRPGPETVTDDEIRKEFGSVVYRLGMRKMKDDSIQGF